MIKKIISVFFAVCACLISAAAPVSAFSAGINDMAGLYSPDELAELEARQAEAAEITGWNIAVVTTDIGMGLDGYEACRYAEQYCSDTFGDDPDSVVYLIDIDYRWISIGGDLYNYFDSSRFNEMMDECEECYMDYDDVGNLETFYYYLEHFKSQSTVDMYRSRDQFVREYTTRTRVQSSSSGGGGGGFSSHSGGGSRGGGGRGGRR